MDTGSSQSKTRVGYFAVAGAAILFSAKAVFIKMGYRYGVEPLVFMALRMLFSLPFFLAMALEPWIRPREGHVSTVLARRDYLGIAALGILGYYLSSLFDFIGLAYVSAGMERLILFIYPTLVILFSAWIFRKRIPRAMLLPLLMTYAGVALSFGEEAAAAESPHFHKGAMLIFLSSICYALFLIFQGRMVHRVGPQRLTSLAMLASTAAVLAQFLLCYPVSALRQPWQVLGLCLVVAVFSTVIPASLLGYGIRLVGAGPAAVVSSVGPVSTLVLASLLLDEKVGILQFLGLAMVLGAGLRLGMSKGEPTLPDEAKAA